MRKLWNIRVMVMPIVIGALEMVSQKLGKGTGSARNYGQIETIQTTALLRSARIFKRVMET